MSRTPDRRPGESDEEGIVLEDRPAGDYPSSTGGMRYVDGQFRFRDSIGIFNPRSNTEIGGADTEVQYNYLGILSGSSNFRFVRSKNALVVTNISGSLTTLADGSPYLRAVGNLLLTTGSSGEIKLSTINSGTIHGVSVGSGLLGGGSSGFLSINIDDSVLATISGSTFTGPVFFKSGLSGSLTKLSNGSDYLVAGNNISLLTSSNGSITIDVVGLTIGGSNTQVQFNDQGSFAGDPDFTFDKTKNLLRVTNISGSLTSSNISSGQVVLTAPGGVLSGSNNLFWVSERLGVGTTSPSSVVHVRGISDTSLTTMIVQEGSSVSTGGSGIFDIRNSSNESLFFVSGSGHVSVGTKSSSARLVVSGSSASSDSSLIVKSGVNLPNAAVVDVQTLSGETLFYVSGSGEIGLGKSISSIQTSVITTSSTTPTTLMTVSTSTFRSAEFIVQGTDAGSSKFSQTKILAIHNGTISSHTIYGAVSIGSSVGTFDVTDPSGGSFALRVTPATTNSTVWKVTGILTRV